MKTHRFSHFLAVSLLASALLPALPGTAATGEYESFDPRLNSGVSGVAVQPDGMIVVGGGFNSSSNVTRFCIARLTSSGALDSLNPGATPAVNCTAIQADGKLLFGGLFTTLSGTNRSRLGRINVDGSIDSSFDPAPNSTVNSLIVQADGRILVGGWFTSFGAGRSYFARLNADGSLDTNFNPNASGPVNCMALQADGKILVGGFFGSLGGVSRSRVGRVNADGTLDATFNPGANSTVDAMAVQPDGKILVGGHFTNLAGVACNYIGRLNNNGTKDTNFNASADSYVSSLVLQADGRIFAAGDFRLMNGVDREFIARLETNGSLETNFYPYVANLQPVSDEVNGVALQADGKVLMVGSFIGLGAQFHTNFARLLNDPATQSLSVPTSNRVQWLRGGTASEAQSVTFELSTNGGASYATLGNGARISGGWELTGLGLPAGGQIRARARTTGGFYNGSSGLIETITFFGPMAAINVSAAETYVEDTPLNLTNIVITSGNPSNITATLTLSTPAAGALTTATAGAATSTFNPTSGVWFASGPIIDVNTLLVGVTFNPATNFNANFTIAISLTNGIDPVITGTKVMTGTPVNDPPTATNLSASESYTEDTALNLADIVISDIDTPNVTATLTLSIPTAGSLSTATSGATTSTYDVATGFWSASGLIAEVNTLLAGVIFNPATNFNANFTIITSVSDQVAPALTGSKTMTGTRVNDPPTATNLSAPETYIEDTALNLTDIVISDVDGGSVIAILTLSPPSAGSLSTGTSGAVTSTYNPASGSWSASGAIADVNALLAGVTFTPATNYNANFTIATSVWDGAAPSITGTKAMTGTPVNDPPAATNLSAPETYAEDTALNLTDIVISDVDGGNLLATLTLSPPDAGRLSTGTSGAVTSTYNAATGVWSASGAIANVNVLLAAVTFNPATNYNANFTIATSVSDGVAAAITGSKAMTGTPVNDPPTATNLSATENFTPDTPLNLTDIVITDVDSATVTATLTLFTTIAGSLTTGTSGAVTSTYNAATGVWSASGAIADVNTLLAAVIFNPATNYDASFTIATSVSDGVAPAISGSKFIAGLPAYPYGQAVVADHPLGYWRLDETGGTVAHDYYGAKNGTFTNALLGQPGNNIVDTHTAAQFGSVASVNSFVGSVPIDFATAGSASFSVECWANGGAQATDSAIITKGVGTSEQFNLDCGSVGHAFRFFVRDASGGVHLANGDVTPNNAWHHLVGVCDQANGKVVLYVDGISNASGTISPGTGLLSSANATTFGSRQSGVGPYDLQFVGSLEEVAIYGSALSASQVLAHYRAANHAPTATNLSAPETYTEDTPLNLINIVISDADSPTVTATLTLNPSFVGTLSTGTSGAVTSTFNPGTGVWSASGAVANVNTLLAGVVFNAMTNYSGSFAIATSVSDGVPPAITGNKTVTGTAVNDPPTATNLSAPESYTEDTPRNLIDIVISDVDSLNATATLTLSPVAAGSLSTGTSGIVTSTFNPATGVWTASGVIPSVNTLLAGVVFTPATNYNANFTIITSVSDGIAPAVTGSKAMTGIPVNDAPTATNLSAPETYTEDTTLNLTDIVINDVDSPNVTATLTVTTPVAGSLSTGTSGAVTSTYNPATGVWSASGAIASVNALLAGVTFSPAANYNANFIITTRVSDGVAPATTGSKAMTGTAVNDPPVFTKGPDKSHPSGTTNAQTFVAWATGIDDGDAELTQALTFNLTNSNPAMFTTTPSVTPNGTLTYTPNGVTGSATISVTLTDDATAGGPALTTAVQTFTITVAASTVEPPVISSAMVLSDGAFQLTFTNTSDTTFSVLATTDLSLPATNWSVLGVSTNLGGGIHGYTDAQATNFPNRFYLLRFP